MYLVIVESPTKTKSLGKYLGRNYKVLSSKGHIWNLPKSELGVDLKHGYEPVYDVIHGKKKIITELQKAARRADKIFLATDLDREGEAIAFQVALALHPKLISQKDKHIRADLSPRQFDALQKLFRRVVFNQITPDAVRAAFAKPRGFDYNLIEAQKARRVLDRLVGYTLSPLLWKKVVYGLSAGRVQSVAVRLIVERENERQQFKQKPYYRVFVKLETNGKPASAELSKSSARHQRSLFTAELVGISGRSLEQKTKLNLFAGPYTYTQTTLDSKSKLDQLLRELNNLNNLQVSLVERKQTSRSPYPPFTTASLQRAAATFLHLSAKQTMRVAQNLYENGYITYHRTDSTRLARDFTDKSRSYVEKHYGKQFVPQTARSYRSKSKNAQEAHEAIRPTVVSKLSQTRARILKELGKREVQLYELIWRRALASQMADAVYDNTTIRLQGGRPNAKGKFYEFEAKGSILKFRGFLEVFEGQANLSDRILPEIHEDEDVSIKEFNYTQHLTSLPPRYNEASLIKALEKHGIGRPSTYAPIIDTIQGRNYVLQEKGAFVPTDTGVVVNSFLVKHFPTVVDLNFTAKMEANLDYVAAGELDWHKMIDQFFRPFKEQVAEKESSVVKSDQTTLGEVGEACPECGKPLVYKLGRFGKFISCSGYPDCKYARPFVEKAGLSCPKCGQEHGGEVIVKSTRKGRRFWGCSRYPDCDWASWDKP